jgi:hypothetical protein
MRKWLITALNLVLLSASLESFAGESDTPLPTPIGLSEGTNSQALLEAILQLQEQLRSNQLAIERTEKEAKEAAALTVEAVSNGFRENAIVFSAQQQAFSALNAWELQVMQSSNRVVLIATGTFAAMVFFAMLMTAYFQWRMGKVWAEFSTVLPMARGFVRGPGVAALGADDRPLVTSGPVIDSNLRLFAAMEQLEKRIRSLE